MSERCVHELFEEQAARTPDAVALVHGRTALTYGQVNAAANRLAALLLAHGLRPETRVALYLDRRPTTIVAMLAVLKAGGAYLPLELDTPAPRLRGLLADADVRIVLTEERWQSAIPSLSAVTVIALDAPSPAGEVARANTDAARSRPTVCPQQLAYVIYTSGSTGGPKGVAVPHAGLSRYVGWAAQALTPSSAPVISSFAFDLVMTSVWVPLVAGGRLELFDAADAVTQLADRLVQGARYGLMKLTPTHLQALAAELGERVPTGSVESLVVGGEALVGEQLARWKTAWPSTTLVNHYGPTETVVGCCFHPQPLRDVRAGRVPIGRPAPGVRGCVRDGAGQLVPVGVTGELFIGGGQMARGYLGRAALTAERFVPDPFGEEAGARLYRTGDRVRRRTDGALEYLGRFDTQVKIRGYRVEPAEVEAIVATAPGVREARVLPRPTASGDAQLVAYVVGAVEPEALRAHVRQQAPEYLVPAAFVRLEAWPLTPNGKLDVRALPDPAAAATCDDPPRTPIEKALAEIWAGVLRRDRINRGDNFFELGGDSIMAIQVASRARRAGVHLMPRQVFESQTIAALALAASAATPPGGAEQGRVEGRSPLTPIQCWFFEQHHPTPWHYNQSLLLAVSPAIDERALHRALQAVLTHHDALRLRFRRTDAGWEQWHGGETGIEVERVDLTGRTPQDQDRAQDAIEAERQASLDLERGPLGRALLFDRGGGDRRLLLILHHLVVDGVSWRVLREDLERAGAQAMAGRTCDLGAKSSSFQQWAAALQRHAASGAMAAEAAYWLAQGAVAVRPLPVDGSSAATVAASRTVTVHLTEDETRRLTQDVSAAYRTGVNDVLLCALTEAICAWTGDTRLRVALESHGRQEEVGSALDLTRTVGWLTSVYPVVFDRIPSGGPARRLMGIKEQLRGVPTHGIGYGMLRYLGPDARLQRELAAQQAPEILVNYLGQFDHDDARDGVFRVRAAGRGHDAAEGNRRSHRLLIGGGIRDGCLHLHWTYPDGAFRRATIEWVAGSCLSALRDLIAHCGDADAGACTPSDFPLAGLTQAELDTVLGVAGHQR
jgi:amino acid adenylation domain-containing protein/non-ribosomal peptide synthase protein (TIGR01720 family)